ncbi:preprotein translocase subunit SecG [Methylomonas methanica]|uniref:Protein-export membrane protein SecG n=1 Tax=Methylomonas methanica (strain DSM 25384 / MC09) TaxID=857087 RepID=G0A5F4_METMM|nr:preprotein translocase, SecG subunit [Methylomonas methanica MC09]
MLYQIIIVIHILLGIGIIGLVLMQQGKGADAGAAFGSGASGSVFGAQGSASFLSRTTAIFASLFFVTSLGLAFLSGYHGKKTDIMDVPAVEQVTSDVPLSQNKADDSVPVATLPEAPAIKEVQPAE